MKYVIAELKDAEEVAGVADQGYHRDIFEKLEQKYGRVRLVGAAHCLVENGSLVVFGESFGFRTKANERDREILQKLLDKGELHV